MPKEFSEFLGNLPGRTAAIVYSFAPAKRPKELWYDRWQTEVLSFYGQAIQGLGVEPYFMDVDSFCERAIAGRLPDLDFVINLNAGVRPISNWALVPAVASWCDIAILPCEADIIIAGERKDLSNLVAEKMGLRIPHTYTAASLASLPPETQVIAKPRDLGGSEGIEIRPKKTLEPKRDYIYQEVIAGYDITLPVLYDPVLGSIQPLPAVAYRPANDDPRWFHSRESKIQGVGYQKKIVDLAEEHKAALISFAEEFGIITYCRLDLRVAAGSWAEAFEVRDEPPPIYFIEINPMPTLRRNINFISSLQEPTRLSATQSATLSAVQSRCQTAREPQLVQGAWVLACAMYARTHNQV